MRRLSALAAVAVCVVELVAELVAPGLQRNSPSQDRPGQWKLHPSAIAGPQSPLMQYVIGFETRIVWKGCSFVIQESRIRASNQDQDSKDTKLQKFKKNRGFFSSFESLHFVNRENVGHRVHNHQQSSFGDDCLKAARGAPGAHRDDDTDFHLRWRTLCSMGALLHRVVCVHVLLGPLDNERNAVLPFAPDPIYPFGNLDC